MIDRSLDGRAAHRNYPIARSLRPLSNPENYCLSRMSGSRVLPVVSSRSRRVGPRRRTIHVSRCVWSRVRGRTARRDGKPGRCPGDQRRNHRQGHRSNQRGGARCHRDTREPGDSATHGNRDPGVGCVSDSCRCRSARTRSRSPFLASRPSSAPASSSRPGSTPGSTEARNRPIAKKSSTSPRPRRSSTPRRRRPGATFTADILEKIPTARDPWQIINMTPGVQAAASTSAARRRASS